MANVFDCVIVGLYWMVCSLPIITLGAASTAAMSVLLEVDKTSGSITRSFFSAFKSNFRQSTVLWSILLAAGALLAWEIYLCSGKPFDEGFGFVVKCTLIPLAIFYSMCVSSIFAITAKFKITVGQAFYNTLVLTFRHPLWMVLMTAQTAIVALGFYLLLAFGFVTAAIGLYGQSRIFRRMVKEYFPEDAPVSEEGLYSK